MWWVGGELKFPLLCAAKVDATLMTMKCAVAGLSVCLSVSLCLSVRLSVSRSPSVFNLAVMRFVIVAQFSNTFVAIRVE